MFKRKLISEIEKYLKTRDVIVIHGARQTGKTTLLMLLMEILPDGQYYYLDLEDSRLLEICNLGTEAVLTHLKERGVLKDNQLFYLLIDEIQYLDKPSSFLKITHDHYDRIKLIVSGSSSFNIKSKFKDSLVGRTVDFVLYPLDFEEFLLFKEKSFNFAESITSQLLINELILLYKEYNLYGGYPKIVLTDSIEMKERYLQQIIDTYIKSDIRDLARIRNIHKFNKLLLVLANQSANMLNLSELANTTQLAKQTVEEYLFILENTYIIKRLQPFSGNLRSELFKRPKIFFYDTGICHMLGQKILPRIITGNSFETGIFGELIKNTGIREINYWRTQDKKEIDFIIRVKERIFPIEVKINAAKIKHTPLRYFLEKYNLSECFALCLEGDYRKEFKGLKVLSPWEIRNLTHTYRD